jgi:hypothetical protein
MWSMRALLPTTCRWTRGFLLVLTQRIEQILKEDMKRKGLGMIVGSIWISKLSALETVNFEIACTSHQVPSLELRDLDHVVEWPDWVGRCPSRLSELLPSH